MTEIYNEELKRQSAEKYFFFVLRDQIAGAGINCDKIEIDVNISEDSIISISKVIITADDFEAAASIVRSSVGSETEVVMVMFEKLKGMQKDKKMLAAVTVLGMAGLLLIMISSFLPDKKEERLSEIPQVSSRDIRQLLQRY